MPIYATSAIFDALAVDDLDFAFVDPSTYACLSVSQAFLRAAAACE